MPRIFHKVNDWRSRWVNTLGRGTKIHRLAKLTSSRKAWREYPSGRGETVCGIVGMVWMPGFLSRLAAARCPKCCKLVGIPTGNGAPYNDPTLFPPEGKAIVTS